MQLFTVQRVAIVAMSTNCDKNSGVLTEQLWCFEYSWCQKLRL